MSDSPVKIVIHDRAEARQLLLLMAGPDGIDYEAACAELGLEPISRELIERLEREAEGR